MYRVYTLWKSLGDGPKDSLLPKDPQDNLPAKQLAHKLGAAKLDTARSDSSPNLPWVVNIAVARTVQNGDFKLNWTRECIKSSAGDFSQSEWSQCLSAQRTTCSATLDTMNGPTQVCLLCPQTTTFLPRVLGVENKILLEATCLSAAHELHQTCWQKMDWIDFERLGFMQTQC